MIRYNLGRLQTTTLPTFPYYTRVAFWDWATLHAETELFSVRFLFWSRTYRFRDLFPLLERIIPRP